MRRVAALVNVNAYRVTPEIISTLETELGDAHVYATRSLTEARAAINAIAAAQTEVLCIVGGDGTFVQAVTDVLTLAEERRPTLFPLPYGLGNAIADVSGARRPTRRNLVQDLMRARLPEPGLPLLLLRANGRVACYAGLGMDAGFVEDLYAVAKGRWKRVFATLGGATGLVATVLQSS